MRIDRWYWLIVFCAVSLGLHLTLRYVHASLLPEARRDMSSAGLEVTLAPPDVPPAPAPVPKAAPVAKKAEPWSEPRDTQPVGETQEPAQIVKNETPVAHSSETTHARPLEPAAKTEALTPMKTASLPKAADVPDDSAVRNEAPPVGLPNAPQTTAAPRIASTPKTLTVPKDVPGGGSPAPDKTLTGKGGAAGPESPTEDVVYSGGGAGGQNLPKAPAKIGGGGGNSILSIENPLAKEAIPEDKPGLGPGTGGGAGTGSGGGAGFHVGKGVGTRGTGKDALATLNSKPGSGIGASSGNGIGTKAPGGGKGTGAEMPGTGGEGTGYGKGKGIDIGAGNAPHAEMAGLSRGIPFGDITGMLGTAKVTGGGGSPGRGGVFGQAPRLTGGGGGGGRIHIIYLLDTSGSMKDYGKIFKAADALKRALVELRPTDTFNVMNFDNTVHVFTTVMNMEATMVPATKDNIKLAWDYIDNLRLAPYTNLSSAIDRAFQEPTVTHIFILSDGEPHGGIEDFIQLRAFVRDKNQRKIPINTLALGVGEKFPGMRLLRSIAEENDGQYAYVNLLSETPTAQK